LEIGKIHYNGNRSTKKEPTGPHQCEAGKDVLVIYGKTTRKPNKKPWREETRKRKAQKNPRRNIISERPRGN